MLFNSYAFIFLFLPPVLGIFFLLRPAYRFAFLVIASVVFYAQWHFSHTVLLLASVGVNFLLSRLLMRETLHPKAVLAAGVALNLLPLLWFKYGYFLHLSSHSLVLPLAISFYTFQQIAYLVDVYRKRIVSGSFREYVFFVLFFPQLIAGPIVHYRQIISQVQKGVLEKTNRLYVHAGIVLFSIGLFKKVLLADGLFPIADRAFDQIGTLGSADAWTGVLAYSLGIYFDFSGYTDMAIGLALLLGIRLPMNFNSPYKAEDMVAFWRKWHMTLSHFLRDYIYIPLGGNRKGPYREVFNLMATMTLGGIWHGAGWNFLLWGAGHGILLVLVHLKHRYLERWQLPRSAAIFFTFLAVTLLWVLFRSETMAEALVYYRHLFGLGGTFAWNSQMLWIGAGLLTVWALPNSMQAIGYPEKIALKRRHAVLAGVLAFAALKMMAEAPAESFVYFNF